jgi:hypothetical protein
MAKKIVSDLTVTGNISGANFFGDGSGLTSVTGTDSTKLPLAGGTITSTLLVSNVNPAIGFASTPTTGIVKSGSNGMSLQVLGSTIFDLQSSSVAFLRKATFVDGSVSSPGISFWNDSGQNTGIYMIGENNLGFSANGVRQGDFSTSGLQLASGARVNSIIENLTGASSTTLATSESVKSYVDAGGVTPNALPLSGGTMTGDITLGVSAEINMGVSNLNFTGGVTKIYGDNGPGVLTIESNSEAIIILDEPTGSNTYPISLLKDTEVTGALITQNISGANIYGTFIGDGSGLTDLPAGGGTPNALPLSGGIMTGPALFPDGTESLPSINFADVSSGIYWENLNGVSLADGGVRVFSAGLGEVYSSSPLRVLGTISATGNISGANFFGNGSGLTDIAAGGSTTELLFNNAGVVDGLTNITFSSGVLTVAEDAVFEGTVHVVDCTSVYLAQATPIGSTGGEGTISFDSATNKFLVSEHGGGFVDLVKDLGAVTESIIPDTSGTYDLGTASKPWGDLYLTDSTLHLGDVEVSVISGALSIDGSGIVTENTLTNLPPATSVVDISGTSLTITEAHENSYIFVQTPAPTETTLDITLPDDLTKAFVFSVIRDNKESLNIQFTPSGTADIRYGAGTGVGVTTSSSILTGYGSDGPIGREMKVVHKGNGHWYIMHGEETVLGAPA